ncbi:hypothetical protein ACN26Y_16140 [Micromonospora sp. WMMD558]|uniref:hypothetical protein n=1 Tax=Micromonospora sp. WMMD558 TaxID=3403462 RepID=UPI003BF5B8AA
MAEFDIQIQAPVFLRVMTAGLRCRQVCPPPPVAIAGLPAGGRRTGMTTDAD